jgi:uncharacterized protein (TIGR03437 family)
VEVAVCLPPAVSPRCQQAELVYVSPAQINFVLPDHPSKSLDQAYAASFRVRRIGEDDLASKRGSPVEAAVYPHAPAIFISGYDCRFPTVCDLSQSATTTNSMARGAIIDQDGRLVSSKNPIRPSKDYSIYLTGLGVGRDEVQLFESFPVTISLLLDDPQNRIILTETEISYIGRAPNFPGLDQINFRLPRDVLKVLGPTPKCLEYRGDVNLVIASQVGTSPSVPISPVLVSLPVLILPGEVNCQ